MNNDERCDKLSENHVNSYTDVAWTIGLEERHRDEYKHERIPTTTATGTVHMPFAGSDLVVSPRRSISTYEILPAGVAAAAPGAAGGTEVAPNPVQNVKSTVQENYLRVFLYVYRWLGL